MVTKRNKNVSKQSTGESQQKTLQMRAGRNIEDSKQEATKTEDIRSDSFLKKRGSSMKPPRNKTPSKDNPFTRPGRESMQKVHSRAPSQGADSSLPHLSQA